MARTAKPKPLHNDANEAKGLAPDLCYRAYSASESTLDETTRSIEGIAASEAPVPMYDWQRDEVIPEILLMSGAKFDEGRSVPLLNAHMRWEARDVIGSAKELRVDGDKLMTRAVFSSIAEDVFTLVKERHLRDLSVGYRVNKRMYVPAGDKAVINGRTFTGPVNVVTSWTVREVSVTPIGADQHAKLRGLANPLDKESYMLAKELRDKLVARGMPADLSDEDAIRWSVENPAKPDNTPEKKHESRSEASEPVNVDEAIRKALKEQREEIRREQEAERSRIAFVNEQCRKHGINDADARDIIASTTSETEAGRKILDKLADRQAKAGTGFRIEYGPERSEKFAGAVGAALTVRALQNCTGMNKERLEKLLPEKERADGWKDFQHSTLFDMARECVESAGVSTRGLDRATVAKVALGFGRHVGIRADYGFHTTGNFPNLMLDAINKSLLAGYQERAFTWSAVFRQAASASDFKNIHRIRMSEAPNISIWPDNTRPEEIAFTDEKETYAVESYANLASFSYRSLVNDDMDALSRVPQLMGTAAARTVNAIAWAQITSNPTLQDGVSLFSSATGARKKANTSTGVVNVANLGTAKSIMRLQVGVNTKGGNASSSILNLEPRYLVVPATIETTAAQILNSVYDPADNKTQVFNPFSGSLRLIVEPLLDAKSTAEWYLFCDPSQCDTVEVTFLAGQETPITNQWEDPASMALMYSIVQTLAAKAIDYRGMVRSTGS